MLEYLTSKLAQIEPRLTKIEVAYDPCCRGYRIAFRLDDRWATVMISDLDVEFGGKNMEEVILNALHSVVDNLGHVGVIDVEFHVERKGLPSPGQAHPF